MDSTNTMISNVTKDALIIGDKSDRAFLFIHGNGGSKQEARAFAEVVVPLGYQVIGIDLPVMEWPEKVLSILEQVKQYLKVNYKSISIRANSIGSWYSLMAFEGEEIEHLVVNEKVYQSFLSSHNCHVEIVDGGEHWFHTPEQLAVLSQWENKVISSINDRKNHCSMRE